ncbi:MAG: polyamine aminopropyltransferase [Ketobacteraceae bacterium]|nr:polyamine aminopropyltransferase [Ketobacteraceae bacterium]
MSQDAEQAWFTEVFGDEGTSFGLAIKGKLHEEQSQFQKLEIYDTETFGKLMVIDDCVMLTERDNFLYHEMMAHPVMFAHPAPRKVAIIGGGDCGTLREILKHPELEQVWQIDIDERVTRLSEQYFPELCESNGDARAELLFDDGIAWIKNRADNSLDVIIVDSTDPVGPAEGLFAVDFYRDCCRALKPDGILVQQTESPLLHASSIIAKAHDDMGAAGFRNVQTLPFPQPVYPTGWWSCTMASAETDLQQFRREAADSKAFATEYYNAAIHQGALAQPEFLKRALGKS